MLLLVDGPGGTVPLFTGETNLDSRRTDRFERQKVGNVRDGAQNTEDAFPELV